MAKTSNPKLLEKNVMQVVNKIKDLGHQRIANEVEKQLIIVLEKGEDPHHTYEWALEELKTINKRNKLEDRAYDIASGELTNI